MLEATPLEREILNDIQNRTGMTFHKIGGIDTRNKQIADAILPILAEWVERIDDRHHRHAIYARFHLNNAQAHFNSASADSAADLGALLLLVAFSYS